MIRERVSIAVFHRMALNNLRLRKVDLDSMTDEEKVDAIAEAYEDETTRTPINRVARRAMAKVVKRASTAS